MCGRPRRSAACRLGWRPSRRRTRATTPSGSPARRTWRSCCSTRPRRCSTEELPRATSPDWSRGRRATSRSSRAAARVVAPGRAVMVPFGGHEHDWAAVELGAWFAAAAGVPLQLIGARIDPSSGRRDASRLLATPRSRCSAGSGSRPSRCSSTRGPMPSSRPPSAPRWSSSGSRIASPARAWAAPASRSPAALRRRSCSSAAACDRAGSRRRAPSRASPGRRVEDAAQRTHSWS